MRKNRFTDMVPPTPTDFHSSVLDALNRLDTGAARRRRAKSWQIAASAVLVLALSAMLTTWLFQRDEHPDTVVSPQQALPTQAVQPEETAPALSETEDESDLTFEVHNWQLSENGLSFDWKLSGPEDETLLFTPYVAVFDGEKTIRQGFGSMRFFENSSGQNVLLGAEILGYGNGAVVEDTASITFEQPPESDVSVFVRIDAYRPITQAFIALNGGEIESFENTPKWMISGGTPASAMPVDYYGRFEYKTPFGADSLDGFDMLVSDWWVYRDAARSEEIAYWRNEADMNRILLESCGFARLAEAFEAEIDSSGAMTLRRIY